jgi:hypothetical protein
MEQHLTTIIPALTHVRSRQLGVPAAACHTHAELLLKAIYTLKTQAGISDQSSSSSDEDPLYGESQGPRWAAAAWVIISTLIIGLMPKKEDGIQFQDSEQTMIVKRMMDGFVDDTTIW